MKTPKLQQILKESLKNKPRSTVAKGLDLSIQVHQSEKSYDRKKKLRKMKIFLDGFEK